MHPKTLFHLVPTNKFTHKALLHRHNKDFVSPSNLNDVPGLEIGFHVSSSSEGHVIATLGRDADLILNESPSESSMSRVYAAFEINPYTNHVHVSDRSKEMSSVSFSALRCPNLGRPSGEEVAKNEEIKGDGIILYAQNYSFSIASYQFHLIWCSTDSSCLEALAIRSYKESVEEGERQSNPRYMPTVISDSEAQPWRLTRVGNVRPMFEDIRSLRTRVGQGGFGVVYRVIDRATANEFAIKVVSLGDTDMETLRGQLNKEVEIMGMLKHVGLPTTNGFPSVWAMR